MRLQAAQQKMMKGFDISAEERVQLGRRGIYQAELDMLESDSQSAGDMTMEEELMERQRQHEAKLAKRGVKVRPRF